MRIGLTHVSIATAQAVEDTHGHGTPTTKFDSYDSSASTHLTVSDTEDKSRVKPQEQKDSHPPFRRKPSQRSSMFSKRPCSDE